MFCRCFAITESFYFGRVGCEGVFACCGVNSQRTEAAIKSRSTTVYHAIFYAVGERVTIGIGGEESATETGCCGVGGTFCFGDESIVWGGQNRSIIDSRNGDGGRNSRGVVFSVINHPGDGAIGGVGVLGGVVVRDGFQRCLVLRFGGGAGEG